MASFDILPKAPATLRSGENLQFYAFGVENSKEISLTNEVSWTSSDPSVGTIDESGFFKTTSKSGTTTISATLNGDTISTSVVSMGDSFTLYFHRPDTWPDEAPHIWLWNDVEGEITNYITDTWPGTPAEEDLIGGGSWFRFTLTKAQIDNLDEIFVLFNCGSSLCQTKDYKISSGRNLWLKDDLWSGFPAISEASVAGTQIQIGNGKIFFANNGDNQTGKLFRPGTELLVRAEEPGAGQQFVGWEGTGTGLLLDPTSPDTKLIVDDRLSMTLLAVFSGVDDPYADIRDTFKTSCSGCHGSDGKGGVPLVDLGDKYDRNELIKIITEEMPLGNPSQCTGNCATDLADMILDNAFEEPVGVCRADNLEDIKPQQRSVKLMTNFELENTLRDLLNLPNFKIEEGRLPSDIPLNGFKTDSGKLFTKDHVKGYLLVAEDAAEQVNNPLALTPQCSNVDCFVREFGKKAFRRPLNSQEESIYRQLGRENGIEEAMISLLASPAAIYRSELGTEITNGSEKGLFKLTDYEIASQLSYTYWASTPDDTLLSLAEQGKLSNPATIKEQATRLLKDPKARPALRRFLLGWLDLDKPIKANISESLKEDMVMETLRFVEDIIYNDGFYEDLLTADYTYLTQALADHYGLPWPGGSSWQKVTYQGVNKERRGILGHASILAAQSTSEETHPIKRGLFLRRNLLCQDFPPPPIGAELKPISDPSLTVQERFEAHIKPDCAVCHQYIDGVGYGTQNYDYLGRFRTTETTPDGTVKELTIEGTIGSLNSAETFLSEDEPVETFYTIDELGSLIADSKNGKACMARQWYRYTNGYRETRDDSCTLDVFGKAFKTGNRQQSVFDLLVNITQTRNYTLRR